MKIQQVVLNKKEEVIAALNNPELDKNDFHFIFCDKLFLTDNYITDAIKSTFNKSILIGCSSAGEIGNKEISEGAFVLTSVKLEKSTVRKSSFILSNISESYKAGEYIAKQLADKNLKHVFVLSEGLNVNGTRLVEGINSVLDNSVNVSGGLAGDNGEFIKTYVTDMDNNFIPNCISAIGFYGESIISTSGSYGGWDTFGIDRIVTKSNENVVFEIDGKPALDLYKSYLGDLSANLPGSGLFFPLGMKENENSELLVRTILAVDEEKNSLTFAGNIPEGAYVRLMKTNMERVIAGAEKAAQIIKNNLTNKAELVLMISCIGRKLVLKQLTQDEVDAVTENLNSDAYFAGFYSYGELSKISAQNSCSLHNQTMTLTAISEI